MSGLLRATCLRRRDPFPSPTYLRASVTRCRCPVGIRIVVRSEANVEFSSENQNRLFVMCGGMKPFNT